MIKVVVIDLDGTLLNQDHCISLKSIETLRQLHAKGIDIILATGRHYQDVYLLAQQLNIPVRLITSNGARVHSKEAKLIYENHIPPKLVEQILSLSAGYEVHRNLYQQDLWLVEEPNKPLLNIHHSSGFAYRIINFRDINYQHIDKFYFNASHQKLKPLYDKLITELGDQLYITFTTDIYLEIMNKGVSKGHALAKVLQQQNIQPAQVMAFGDGLNDSDMLKLVGHPVLMANAHPDLKKQLPHAAQTTSNAEDGVANYIQKQLL